VKKSWNREEETGVIFWGVVTGLVCIRKWPGFLKEGVMGENKGKPSGKYAQEKASPGRKGDLKRGPWPEDAPTQHVNRPGDALEAPGEGSGRNRKAGGG
jgi:hypothetical protein